MSTRSSIKYELDDTTGNGFHLFGDVLDDEVDAPVYLELTGIYAATLSYEDGHAVVLVTIPRDWARKLGLLKKEEGKA